MKPVDTYRRVYHPVAEIYLHACIPEQIALPDVAKGICADYLTLSCVVQGDIPDVVVSESGTSCPPTHTVTDIERVAQIDMPSTEHPLLLLVYFIPVVGVVKLKCKIGEEVERII